MSQTILAWHDFFFGKKVNILILMFLGNEKVNFKRIISFTLLSWWYGGIMVVV